MFLLCWCVQSVLAAKHCSSHGGGNFVEGLTFANGTTFEVPKKCTSLDLSYNDLGPQHAVKLAAALEGSKVESLIISHNKLQDEGLKALLPPPWRGPSCLPRTAAQQSRHLTPEP